MELQETFTICLLSLTPVRWKRFRNLACVILSHAGVQKLLALFPLLRKLHLDAISGTLTDGDVELLCKSLPYLLDLALHGFDILTSTALESIARCFPLLQRLTVSYCKAIDDEGVIAVAKGCAQLIALDISHCHKITDKAVREVWLRCLLLQDLHLSSCVRVTDAAFAKRVNPRLQTFDCTCTYVTGAFFRQMPKMVYLYCDCRPHLNSDFISRFIRNPATTLEYVCLSYTKLNVSDLLVVSIHLPRVQYLRLSHSNADDSVVRSIVAHCPRFKNLSVHSWLQ